MFLIKITKEKWFYEKDNATFEINRHDFSLLLPEGKIKFDVVFNMIHGNRAKTDC